MTRAIFAIMGAAIALLAAPPAIRAQQSEILPRIGFLGTGPERVQGVFVDAFRSGLRDAGLVDGRNVVLDVHFGNSNPSRIRALAAELVRRDVDVIVPVALTAVREAAKATKTIPIVAAFAANLVGSGLVASLAKPGGNVTGMSTFARDLVPKWLQLVKEVVPEASRVAVLFNPFGSSLASVKILKTAAARIGVAIHEAPVRAPDDFEDAFAAIARVRAGALIMIPGRVTGGHRRRLIALAIGWKLPAMCWRQGLAHLGCLMSYGANRSDLVRRSASYVAKILMGAKPADLPVERPDKFDLVIHLKTAKTIGITIPPSILLRATEVIE